MLGGSVTWSTAHVVGAVLNPSSGHFIGVWRNVGSNPTTPTIMFGYAEIGTAEVAPRMQFESAEKLWQQLLVRIQLQTNYIAGEVK